MNNKILVAALLALSCVGTLPAAEQAAAARSEWRGTTVTSPNRAVSVTVLVRDHRLQYSVSLHGQPVIDASDLGIVVDGVHLGENVVPGKIRKYRASESYRTRGVHATATSRGNGQQIAMRQAESGARYVVEVRAYDDGIAFRTVVPPGAAPRVADEATSFTIPAGSIAWYHGMRGHYEGRHTKKEIAGVEAGEWAAPPLTFKLPGGHGYGAITEANLVNFSGMALQAAGQRRFAARLGHAQPASYPYTLRYGEAEAARLAKPAAIDGEIATPWRVVLAGQDLNTLVNSDMLTSLNPPPDRALFPDGMNTGWVKPGRAVWKYLDDPARSTVELMRQYTDLAHELGFEYQVVEGFWSRWPEEQLREFIQYSRQRGVGIFLWKHTKDLHDPEARRKFFQLCHDAGAAGVKLDFMDHEAKEVVDFYTVLLKEAAEQHLLVNFHGANKPTGGWRTWPNELTREAVAGMESRGPRAGHDATLPFTRFLAGPADYTPVLFTERRGDTTWAHQIATAVVFTSPLLTFVSHPKRLLENPAVETIRAIPATWDETRVLPGSEIGEVAMFARRTGNTWFVGIVNGPTARTVRVPLAFLANGEYRAQFVRDGDADDAVRVETAAASPADALTIEMRAGGGFVGRFWKPGGD